MNKLVLISLPKCGTNLVGNLLGSAGYRITGEGIDNRFPSWCQHLDREFIAAFPEKTCCVFHTMSAAVLDGRLMHLWREQNSPKIIFNYRDPRAALVSMINYLLSGKYSGAGWQQIGRDILQQIPDKERVSFAIDYFDEFLFKKYRESSWLLWHPSVLCTSFEKLAGPEGGGNLTDRMNEIARIYRFADCPAGADLPLNGIERKSRTFLAGKIDSWRTHFMPADLRKFQGKYGDLLETFGYPG